MQQVFSLLHSYGLWLILLLAIVFYKTTLKYAFGMIIIPENKMGQVKKKFVLFGKNKSLPDGKIMALNGEPGYQADTLAPGLYWWYFPWHQTVELTDPFIVGKGMIGLVVAKDGASLPTGAILARSVPSDDFQNARLFLTGGGQRGKQVAYINSGVYRINRYLFDLQEVAIKSIKDGMIGVITALDGVPLGTGTIAGKTIDGHNNFQDFDKFLQQGGQRGLQIQVVQAGNYSFNPWAVDVEEVQMTVIPIGHVGVIISFVGEEGKDKSGTEFKHGNIVEKNCRGVWETPYDPGKYAINPYAYKVEIVPTTNIVLNWANTKSEAHNLDKGLSTITVRSKDGFPFNLDVSQIIHIPSTDAPMVIARFGSMLNLVSQVLEPTIGNYFRNSSQNTDIIEFLRAREKKQGDARESIKAGLEKYNVHAVDTLIGDINPPEALMKTLTDRKIAEEEKTTFSVQTAAQDQRKIFESAKALANMQPKMVEAQQSVEIAEKTADATVKAAKGDSESIEIRAKANGNAKVSLAEATARETKLTGDAEAGKIEAIGDATAKSYKVQVEALGQDNFSRLKNLEVIGTNHVRLIPDNQYNLGGGNGDSNTSISALLGLETMKIMKEKSPTAVSPKKQSEPSDKA